VLLHPPRLRVHVPLAWVSGFVLDNAAMAQPVAEQTDTVVVAGLPTSNMHLLLVGESRPIREAEASLIDEGHSVDRVAGNDDALMSLQRRLADVVVVQWDRPGPEASALIESIRQRDLLAGAHVIALLPEGRGLRAVDALEAGADDYLHAPTEVAELTARVRIGLRMVQLRTAEARLRTLIDNVPGAIYRCANDSDWTMELIGDEIERISGYPAFEFLQSTCRSFASVIHPEDRERVSTAISEAVDQERPFVLEYRVVRADGDVRWVLERGQLVQEGRGRSWLDGVLFDITERRLAEQALREREAQRARLQEVEASRARIVAAADAARRRLERDLHDGAQQRLVALALNLRLARDRLDGDPEEAAELLENSQIELEQATAELRELARGLHPPVLTDRGLGPALRSLADRTPIDVEVAVEIEDRLPTPLETAAYFMVAETLTNVVKHAEANRVQVSVVLREGRCIIEVADDGAGGAAANSGSGLSGLRDRFEALDGRLEVHSVRGSGTVVRATIPCPPTQHWAPAAS